MEKKVDGGNALATQTFQSTILSLDTFVRSISVNSGVPHSIFLGAGASISSGVASAETCIWEWKREIFLSNNPGLETQFGNIDLPVVRERIQKWLDVQGGYPILGSDDEYGFYIEACYPLLDDRRQFFAKKIKGVHPYMGYKQLCLLAEEGLFDAVWTTNFDNLVARASQESSMSVVEVGLDSPHRVERLRTQGELLHIALHGDYRYDKLKNTALELQQQNEQLRKAFIEHARTHNIIVVGYSGRDHSIMDMFAEAYSTPGSGRLYWCGHHDPSPNNMVANLISVARQNNREAYYVSALGFDDLMDRLAVKCLQGDRLKRAYELRKKSVRGAAPFALSGTRTVGLIKGNMLEIVYPKQVKSVPLNEGVSNQEVWRVLRERSDSNENFVAVPFSNSLLILGDSHAATQKLSDYLVADSTQLYSVESLVTHGAVRNLFLRSLVKQLARHFRLINNGENVLWEQEFRERRIKSMLCRVHDGVVLYLRVLKGKHYLVLKPTIVGTDSLGKRLPPEIDKELKRSILTYQYNSKFDEAFMKWRLALFPKSENTFAISGAEATAFTIKGVPIYARMTSDDVSYSSVTISHSIEPFVKEAAVQLKEPSLLFSNKDGTHHTQDTSPIRGIVRNRPLDFRLTTTGFNSETKLGVICPDRDEKKLYDFLTKLTQRIHVDSKAEYLLDYPGYANAFGLALEVPISSEPTWANCAEPDALMPKRSGLLTIYNEIIKNIESISAAAKPNLIVIYIPSRWKYWESHSDDTENMDLHDMVKAYCVQRGIATQFLREETLHKSTQCEIRWWLSLSLYAKCMRTPWSIADSNPDTAYVGIGYSYDHNVVNSKRQVVLGCSHIYDSNGLGLRYRVGKIEKPIFRNRNPHMSRDDARRMGETIREQFFNSTQALPKRVVFHKNSPFIDEERTGLLEGMAGVDIVDMIEINVENAIRFIASKPMGNKFGADGFPIRRGTCLVLSDNEALVWSHGTTNATGTSKRYYQGKSRIPAPLVVRRYHGNSSLSVLGSELLGLSKMDWNTFDMYTREPATIHTSSRIARIGTYINDYGTMSFDYRLFM